MKKNFILGLCMLWGTAAFAQADIHFTQFYETTILRNPALLGVSTNNFKISGYVRSQWSSITNPYQTALFDVSYRLKAGRASDDFFSFGILAYMDEAGDLNQKISGFYPAINFNKSLSRYKNTFLSFGITGGYLQYGFDRSLATFNNQFQGGVFNTANPANDNLPTPHFSIFDVGAGLNFNISPNVDNNVTYIVGVSCYHFTQPDFSYYNHKPNAENMRWNGNLAFIKELNDAWMLQLHGNYSGQGTYNELIAGGLLGWIETKDEPGLEFWFGAMYRLQDAIAPVVKLKYKNVGLGISYDVNLSTLKEASNMQGGLEITLNIAGNIPKNSSALSKTVCPRF